MKKLISFIMFAIILTCASYSYAGFEAVFVIKPKESSTNYSNEDLKMRIWELEKAVFQLQQKVFALELNGANQAPKVKYTCYMSVFGKTFTATDESEMKAKANTISDCSKSYNAMHCGEENIKCGK